MKIDDYGERTFIVNETKQYTFVGIPGYYNAPWTNKGPAFLVKTVNSNIVSVETLSIYQEFSGSILSIESIDGKLYFEANIFLINTFLEEIPKDETN